MSRKRKPAKPEVQASPEAERIVKESELVAETILAQLDVLGAHKLATTGGVILGLSTVIHVVLLNANKRDQTLMRAILLEALAEGGEPKEVEH